MEFPSLGKNCSESACKQLDFLPMKCDACANIYCRDHIHYNTHRCSESYKRDNQVPVCPLCNKPIPVQSGELPDVKVGQHIDSDCQSDPAKERRGKIYTNKCSYKGCKQKELIPVKCDNCQLNFCLKHRHETDHSCNGFQSSGRGISNAGASAFLRAQAKKPSSSSSVLKSAPRAPPQQTTLSSMGFAFNRARQERQASRSTPTQPAQSLQNGLSEDEAIARAVEMSLAQSQPNQAQRPLSRQEREDEELAAALAASEQQERQERRRRQQQAQQQKSSCQLS